MLLQSTIDRANPECVPRVIRERADDQDVRHGFAPCADAATTRSEWMKDRVYASAVATALGDPPRTDEELMHDLAHGHQEALGPLYSRYASLVFHLGVQSLDRPAAEELVQEVFLTIWRGAASFDPG